jgi:hypothetical protein
MTTEIKCMFLHKKKFKTPELEKLFPHWKQTKQYLGGHRLTTDNAETNGNG